MCADKISKMNTSDTLTATMNLIRVKNVVSDFDIVRICKKKKMKSAGTFQ